MDLTYQPPQPRKLPAWVAGLAVLLLLAGSAWALYRLVWQDKAGGIAVESVPVAPPGRGFGGGGPGFGRGGPGRMDVAPSALAGVSRLLSGRIRAYNRGVLVFGIPKKTGGFDAV